MSKGDYAGAESLAAKGRELQQFMLEVDVTAQRWRALNSGAKEKRAKQTTPLWSFYQPILVAIEQCGGQATLAEIEPRVQKIMESTLMNGDIAVGVHGRPRWSQAVRRARKHLVGEGWVEYRKGTYRLTEKGRRTAEKPPSGSVGS